jgi:hypothetical protein
MNCNKYREWVAADVDGVLGAEAESARRHLAECRECCTLRKRQAAMRAVLRAGLPAVEAPVGLRTRIVVSLDEEAERRSVAAFWWRPLRWAAFGLAAAAVVIGLIVFPRGISLPDSIVMAYAEALTRGPSVRVSGPDELERFYRSQPGLPTHIQDLSKAGFHLVGGTVEKFPGRMARLSTYTDGETVVLCDYVYARKFPLELASGERLFFSRGGLSFSVSRHADEICVLVTRASLDAFRGKLLGSSSS